MFQMIPATEAQVHYSAELRLVRKATLYPCAHLIAIGLLITLPVVA